MLFSLGYMPLITKATRITDHSKTLIDRIYTNLPEKVLLAGICLVDISDHLPCFCTLTSKLQPYCLQKFHRDFSSFNNDSFLCNLNKVDFMSFITSDVNLSMNKIIKALNHLADKHAPLKKVSNAKK